MDLSTLGSAFSQVVSYASNAMTYTLATTTDGIVSGTTYSFKFLAVNAIGSSAFSNTVRFATALPPSIPSTPTKSLAASTET